MIYDGMKRVSKQEYKDFKANYPKQLYDDISPGYYSFYEVLATQERKVVAVKSICGTKEDPEPKFWISQS